MRFERKNRIEPDRCPSDTPKRVNTKWNRDNTIATPQIRPTFNRRDDKDLWQALLSRGVREGGEFLYDVDTAASPCRPAGTAGDASEKGQTAAFSGIKIWKVVLTGCTET